MTVAIVVLVVVLVGAAAFAVSRRRPPDHQYDPPDSDTRVPDSHHGEIGGRGSGGVGGF